MRPVGVVDAFPLAELAVEGGLVAGRTGLLTRIYSDTIPGGDRLDSGFKDYRDVDGWKLPFRGMSRYPDAEPERYPDTPAHREYLERYNTRTVGRVVPPLGLGLAQAVRQDVHKQ